MYEYRSEAGPAVSGVGFVGTEIRSGSCTKEATTGPSRGGGSGHNKNDDDDDDTQWRPFSIFQRGECSSSEFFFLFTRAIFCFHPLTELPPFRCGLFGGIGNVHPESRVVCCLFILSFSKMSAAGFVDVQLENIQEILELHPHPILILSGRHFECRIIFPGCSTFLDMFVTERIRTW